MTANRRQPPDSTRASRALGGLTAASNMSPEARSERSRAAARARWDRVNAERESDGLPPARKRSSEPSAASIAPWLAEVDRRYPDREWSSPEARRRQAVLLLKIATAEAAASALRNGNEAGE